LRGIADVENSGMYVFTSGQSKGKDQVSIFPSLLVDGSSGLSINERINHQIRDKQIEIAEWYHKAEMQSK
jgi:hypothetical protein